jgi:hypothetical protein
MAHPLLTGVFTLAKQEQQKKRAIPAGLQIEQDLNFQAREWRVQRYAWIGIAIVLIAAGLGLFGNGLLSGASVENDGLKLEYDRFGRFQQTTSLRFTISHDSPGAARLFISREYLDGFKIEDVKPPPEKVESNSQGIIYSFSREEGDNIGVTFHLHPEQIGLVSGRIGRANDQPLSFRQFIYP